MVYRPKMKRFEIGLILLVALPLVVLTVFSVRVFNAEVENIELQKRAAVVQDLGQLTDMFMARTQNISARAVDIVKSAHQQGLSELRCLHLATDCEGDPHGIVQFAVVYDGFGHRAYPSSHSLEQTFIEGRFWERLSPQVSGLVLSMINALQQPDFKLRPSSAHSDLGGRWVMTSEGQVHCAYSVRDAFSLESSRIFCALLDGDAIRSEAIKAFKLNNDLQSGLKVRFLLIGSRDEVLWSSGGGASFLGGGHGGSLYRDLASPFGELRFVAEHKNGVSKGFSAPSIGLIAIMLPGALVLIGIAAYLGRARLVEVKGFKKEIERAALISHELRTPLTNIRIYLEMLRRDDLSSSRRTKHFGTIEDEIERLDGLIEQTLGYVTGGSNEERPRETIVPDDVIATLCARFAPLLDADAGRVELNLRAGVPVDLERRDLEQVVINLLDNARKHAPGSDIIVSSQMDGDVLNVVVSDATRDGGSSHAAECKVSSSFSDLPISSVRDKTDGFGLRICREILADRGGVLKACSHGRGRKYSASFNLGRTDVRAPLS